MVMMMIKVGGGDGGMGGLGEECTRGGGDLGARLRIPQECG
jgi:hypothetical protein